MYTNPLNPPTTHPNTHTVILFAPHTKPRFKKNNNTCNNNNDHSFDDKLHVSVPTFVYTSTSQTALPPPPPPQKKKKKKKNWRPGILLVLSNRAVWQFVRQSVLYKPSAHGATYKSTTKLNFLKTHQNIRIQCT